VAEALVRSREVSMPAEAAAANEEGDRARAKSRTTREGGMRDLEEEDEAAALLEDIGWK
jgi:hypothetical protein